MHEKKNFDQHVADPNRRKGLHCLASDLEETRVPEHPTFLTGYVNNTISVLAPAPV
jgi:hypothetical protein